MTFGVVEGEEPQLAELLARAFELAGHGCLLFRDIEHAVHVLHAIRVDSIVVDIQTSGRGGLGRLQRIATIWPDLASRTLLLTTAALAPGEAAGIKRSGAEVVFRSLSLVGVELAVKGCREKARAERFGGSRWHDSFADVASLRLAPPPRS